MNHKMTDYEIDKILKLINDILDIVIKSIFIYEFFELLIERFI